jgi:hypothetical protein
MNFPITIDVARKFYEDHEARDCGETDVVIKRSTSTVRVQLDEEGWSDLKSDAEHYGYGGMDWPEISADDRSLMRSARSIFTKMKRIEEGAAA